MSRGGKLCYTFPRKHGRNTVMKIHVNQVGYRTGSPKYAMIAGKEEPKGAFYLVNAEDTTRVELTVSKFGKDSYSEDALWIADFKSGNVS